MRFEVLKWNELRSSDRQAWNAFRVADPALRSPYFDLGWFDAIDHARGDLMVLRGSRPGRPAAYLPFHPGPLRGARAAGRPLSDWQGVVGAPDAPFDLAAALRAAGVTSFAFSEAPANDAALAPFAVAHDVSHVIDLRDGFDRYVRPAEGPAPRFARNWRRFLRKLDDDGLLARVIVDERDPAVFARLLELKSAQYRRTGQIDILAWRWTRQLLESLFETHGPEFRGLLSSLWIGDRLAAVHFGMQSGGVLHYWFPAYEAAFAPYAPGVLLMAEVARRAAVHGISEIDLGRGDYQFKREFANASAPMISGVAYARSPAGAARSGAGRLYRAARDRFPGEGAKLPDRLVRRVDLAAAAFAPQPVSGRGAPDQVPASGS